MCLIGFINQTATGIPPSASATSGPASKPYLAPLAVLAVLALLLGFLAWYVRRQRQKTRERTAEFAKQMDENAVGKKLSALEFEERLESKKRMGLKDLWLKNRARAARPRSLGSSRSTRSSWTSSDRDAVPMQHLSQTASDDGFGQGGGNTVRIGNRVLHLLGQSAPRATSEA